MQTLTPWIASEAPAISWPTDFWFSEATATAKEASLLLTQPAGLRSIDHAWAQEEHFAGVQPGGRESTYPTAWIVAKNVERTLD
jgi:hypothetical protein